MNLKRSNVVAFLLDYKVLFVIYLIIGIVTAIQSLLLGPKFFNDVEYTHYNNFLIFRQSFYHLLDGSDLYMLYPQEHWDLYKYSPVFALLMAPISILPAWAGLIIWNLLNTLVLFFAVKSLNIPDKKRISYVLWFLVIELVSTTQNSQSNALMVGLMIFSFSFLEKGKPFYAALMIALSFYIKIFGIIAVLFWLLYPKKIRFGLYSLIWLIVLGVLPMIVVSPAQYYDLLKSWMDLLRADQAISFGVSVMGILVSWFSASIHQFIITLIGLVILLLPLVRLSQYKQFDFRILILDSVLIWVIIFNHRAESQTYIIAVAGVGIWYFSQRPNPVNTILVIITFILTCLSPVDFFPRYLREHYVIPYSLKALPVVLVWLKLTYDLMSQRLSERSERNPEYNEGSAAN